MGDAWSRSCASGRGRSCVRRGLPRGSARVRRRRGVDGAARRAEGKAPGCTAGAREDLGQSTVEFALVTAGILAVVVALCAIVRVSSDTTLLALAQQAASHAIHEGYEIGVLLDVLMF
ncbi:MAG: hypothetical protein SOI26_00150 [Coriobacteriales bacterium]